MVDQLLNTFDASISLNQLNPKLLSRKEGLGADDIGDTLKGFGKLLNQEMEKINQLQSDANQAAQTYATGGEIELHNVVLAIEKADMALQLAVQVRNRLVSAYQELSRMQV